MAKPLNLPADLIEDWARRQAAASAKLEGREVPDDYVRSVQAQMFLNARKGGPMRPILMANGQVATWVDDD